MAVSLTIIGRPLPLGVSSMANWSSWNHSAPVDWSTACRGKGASDPESRMGKSPVRGAQRQAESHSLLHPTSPCWRGHCRNRQLGWDVLVLSAGYGTDVQYVNRGPTGLSLAPLHFIVIRWSSSEFLALQVPARVPVNKMHPCTQARGPSACKCEDTRCETAPIGVLPAPEHIETCHPFHCA